MRVTIFVTFLVLTCAYAFLRGGAPERWGAALIGGAIVASHFAYSSPGSEWLSVEDGVLLVDMMLLAALTVLMLHADRYWPIFATGLQAVGTAAHGVRYVESDMIRWTYAVMLAIWSYPILATLIVGTFGHRRRMAQYGTDPSWSAHSPLTRHAAAE